MPVTKSAKRELKKNLKRRLRNLQRKKMIKQTIKRFELALKNKDKEESRKNLNLAYKYLDKAAKTFFHKNKARRIKSRLAKKFFKTFNQ